MFNLNVLSTALLPEGFTADVVADITAWVGDNIVVIGGLLALTAGIGFVLRLIRRSRKSVESTGSKI